MSVDAVVIGAGQRGRFVYGAWARAHPERLRVVALAEPDDERRHAMAREHGLADEARFRDWRDLLRSPRKARVAIVATGDALHVEPALAALEAGYQLLLEKPMALGAGDCLRIVHAARDRGAMLQIGHVLRYAPFYERVREVLDSGVLGEVQVLDLKEHVATWHMMHSYVRGRFRRLGEAAPLLLAKSCHDLDLLTWFAERPARRVSSFGSLGHFRPSRAPAGAAARCSDGCPLQESCPHDAVRFYLGPDVELARIPPWSDVCLDPSREARRRALESGPYGRCVYACDNDVVDHQVVAVEFDGGVTGTFTVHGFASEERRTLRISGSRGELRGVFQEGCIEISRHGRLGSERIQVPQLPALGHHGGDDGLLSHFTRVAAEGDPRALRASGESALASHLLGFAAERARSRGEVVDLAEFRAACEAELALAPDATGP